MVNPVSLDTLAAALCDVIGIDPPAQAAAPNPVVTEYAAAAFDGKKADRIVMYNPDAIAQWVYEKYPQLLKAGMEKNALADIEVPMCAVMPSVTPVCFGTMYTGAQPSVHGIQKYEKPIITIDTIFDALLRAGKKPVILGYGTCSLSNIYLERDMDYYCFNTIDEVNAKAAELLLKDEHDFYVIYNGNYDSVMHKHGPESVEALAELRSNYHAFAEISAIIAEHWQHHNTLVGFAMDHGCHEIDGDCGSHGLDMPEDLNIVHLYKAYKATT